MLKVWSNLYQALNPKVTHACVTELHRDEVDQTWLCGLTVRSYPLALA